MRLSRPLSRPLRPVLASALLALTLTAACGRGDVETPPEKDDLVVARVLERSVWASDVRREAVAQGLIGEGEPLDVKSELFRRVLDEVVDQKLLAAPVGSAAGSASESREADARQAELERRRSACGRGDRCL